MTADIGSICTVHTWIRCVDVKSTCNRGINAKGAFVENMELVALAESRVTLADPTVNNCCR